MTVIAASEISGSAALDDKALKAALGQYLSSPPRRIDRLIFQALLGAVLLKDRVRSDCGLYLASRHPARPTMGALLDAVCVQQRQPKPFEFVNSVSNAAGFHVAQQLGLEGPNLFIGAGPRVWPRWPWPAAASARRCCWKWRTWATSGCGRYCWRAPRAPRRSASTN